MAENISIHAPPRGATKAWNLCWTDGALFQFTPLREGRLCCHGNSGCTAQFQFTPLREGRPAPRAGPVSARTYFNSRPSARGDAVICESSKYRRAFQFTPLREGRRIMTIIPHNCTHFNSRPSARGDQPMVRRLNAALISIHAPPRGATSRSAVPECTPYFNSRPSARGDISYSLRSVSGTIFQFTPLREGRPPLPGRFAETANFNSRPSARGDLPRRRNRAGGRISIHAPPRGATSKSA